MKTLTDRPMVKAGNSSDQVTRLLLVDDDEHNLVSLEAALHGIADELVAVRSGEEALRELLEKEFAAILLDVKMPGLDGFETAELIRSRRRSRHTPILFLTGYRSDDHLFRGYHLGAVDFLFKPIVPEILQSKVRVFVELARNSLLLRQHAENLAKAEQRFRSLLEAAPDAMLITSEDGKILLVNSRTEELFLKSREDLLGRSFSELVPGWIYTGQMYGVELRAVRHDFSEFPAELTSSPLRTDEGILITIVVRDITDRKRAEDNIRRLNAELENRVTTRTAELIRSNDALRQFAWAASHDLQEPLRGIVIYSQLLLRRFAMALPEDANMYLNNIVSGGQRLDGLLLALRDYIQTTDLGQHELTITDATASLEIALQNIASAISEAQAEIHRDELPIVTAVPVLLVQVFQNLIGNAIKYRSQRPPRIRIWAEATEDVWTFSVQDNGIGIDPAHHERIFGVFKRLDRERPGTGIGLAICKTAVERWGGRIWVESLLEEGSTFRFTIPRVPSGADTTPRVGHSKSHHESYSITGITSEDSRYH